MKKTFNFNFDLKQAFIHKYGNKKKLKIKKAFL